MLLAAFEQLGVLALTRSALRLAATDGSSLFRVNPTKQLKNGPNPLHYSEFTRVRVRGMYKQ